MSESISINIQCGGIPVEVVFHKDPDIPVEYIGWDEEGEIIAQEMGFEPSLCYFLQSFIEESFFLRNDKSATAALILLLDHDWGLMYESNEQEERILLTEAGMVNVLTWYGADPNALTDDGEPIISLAANYGHLQGVHDLISAGADIHINEEQALTWAAAGGYTKIIALLLEHGANPLVANSFALLRATEHLKTEAADLLLRAGSNPVDYPEYTHGFGARTALEVASRLWISSVKKYGVASGGAEERRLFDLLLSYTSREEIYKALPLRNYQSLKQTIFEFKKEAFGDHL